MQPQRPQQAQMQVQLPQQVQPLQYAQMQGQQAQMQMTMEQRYLMACYQIFNAVTPENPNYKDQVGTVIYEYVTALCGPKSPKVTGMIIDLPVEDIRRIMQDFTLLATRVQQASELLDQQFATPSQ